MYSEDSILTKQEYIKHFLKIAMILRPNIEPDDLQQTVKEDYEADNANDSITREVLYNSLFELADIWCPDIDEGQYRDFFEYLSFRFRYGNQKDAGAYDVLNT